MKELVLNTVLLVRFLDRLSEKWGSVIFAQRLDNESDITTTPMQASRGAG
jgi:hypothetical protein